MTTVTLQFEHSEQDLTTFWALLDTFIRDARAAGFRGSVVSWTMGERCEPHEVEIVARHDAPEPEPEPEPTLLERIEGVRAAATNAHISQRELASVLGVTVAQVRKALKP